MGKRPALRHTWLRLVVLGTGLIGTAVGGAVVLADRLIFFPPEASYDASMDGLVRFSTLRGDTVAGRYVEVPGASATILFAHGNAEDVGQAVPFHDRMAELGVSVLAFDYPGYGLSTGKPSEPGAYAAIDAAYRWLLDQGAEARSIVVHGRSLGGGIATDLAAREEVAGLILESTFVSAYRVMTRAKVLPVDQFENLDKLPRVSAPVLVIHGGRDAVVAPWHGRHLHDALPVDQRRLLWVDRAGHNDLAYVAGSAYWDALRDFVSEVTPVGGPGP